MPTTDQHWMQQALQLAAHGLYSARPNPMVGAIVVQSGEILGQGWHQQAGTPHAEVHALKHLDNNLQNATLYVTLEPCSHQGRTPPCVELILEKNIGRVVVASVDPNPLVQGQGIKQLKAAGIEVVVGVEAEKATQLNVGFFSRMQRQKPYVRAKLGMSLDSKVAMQSGESQWITSEAARKQVQHWRAQSGAILTSAQTVRMDDCLLSVRDSSVLSQMPEGIAFQHPVRVVLEGQQSIPIQSKLFQARSPVWVATSQSTLQAQDHFDALKRLGVEMVFLPQHVAHQQHVDFSALMNYFAEKEINDVFVEAGSGLLTQLLADQQVDELVLHVAPDLLGKNTIAMNDLALSSLMDKLQGKFLQVQQFGRDLEIRVGFSEYAKAMYKESL